MKLLKKTFIALLIVFSLYSGFWFILATYTKSNLITLVNKLKTEIPTFSVDDNVEVSGFPFNYIYTFKHPSFTIEEAKISSNDLAIKISGNFQRIGFYFGSNFVASIENQMSYTTTNNSNQSLRFEFEFDSPVLKIFGYKSLEEIEKLMSKISYSELSSDNLTLKFANIKQYIENTNFFIKSKILNKNDNQIFVNNIFNTSGLLMNEDQAKDYYKLEFDLDSKYNVNKQKDETKADVDFKNLYKDFFMLDNLKINLFSISINDMKLNLFGEASSIYDLANFKANIEVELKQYKKIVSFLNKLLKLEKEGKNLLNIIYAVSKANDADVDAKFLIKYDEQNKFFTIGGLTIEEILLQNMK